MERGQTVQRLQGPGSAWALVVLIALPAVFAGCMSDAATPDSGPLTLREADTWARDLVARRAPHAHLVGFVGHEGAAPGFLDGLLADYVVDVDTAWDAERGDGRTHAWALLYGTPEGDLLRVVVRDAPRSLEADWAEGASPALVKQLWAMNLGGRLIEDSPSVIEALRASEPAIADHLEAHPDGDVVYASTVAAVDGPGTEDLLYEVYFAAAGEASDGYALYGQVHHFTGRVVATGDETTAPRLHRAVLVEETFTMGPVPLEVWQEQELPRRVEDVRLYLNTTGVGRYRLEVLRDNETLMGGVEGEVVSAAQRHEESLGVLEPGRYTLHVETTGRVTFDLRIDGKIGI